MVEIMREYGSQSDLILFGETFLQGFDSLNWDYEHDKNVGVSIQDPIIEDIRREATAQRVAVSFGYVENDHGVLYSRHPDFAIKYCT